jgi:hypothetical protein
VFLIHRDMRPDQISVGFGLRLCAAALTAVVAVLAAAPSAALAVPVAPAWKLSAVAVPTNFAAGDAGTEAAGPAYSFEATNVGGAATATPVSLQATIPVGVRPLSVDGRTDAPGAPKPECSISSQVVTCAMTAPVTPGSFVGAVVVVETEAGLEGSVSAGATVSGGGGGAAPVSTTVQTSIGSPPPEFGFLEGPSGLSALLTEADGSAASLAGSHPYQLTVDTGFPTRKVGDRLFNSGQPRDLIVNLPRGLVVNPMATPVRCSEAELSTSTCPPASQIGMVTLSTSAISIEASPVGLYNMVPPPGFASNFAFNAGELGVFVHLLGSVRPGDQGLTASARDLLGRFPIIGLRLQLWGDPSSPSHDAAREAKVAAQPRALLTLPSACGPLSASAEADSWQEPGIFVRRSVENLDSEGVPVEVAGCGDLSFSSSFEARATTDVADSPSGLDVNLELPQIETPTARANASLRKVELKLPPGLVANPSAANGLTGCSATEVGLTSPPGSAAIAFDSAPPACPHGSRIGAATIETPVLDHSLPAAVYLASPGDNPFDSLLAVYVAVDDERSGVVLKFAGRVEADPATGQLSVSFDELPQIPIAGVELRLFDNPGLLRTPGSCGLYPTTATLTPWSAPASGPPLTPSDSFPIDRAPIPVPCASGEGSPPAALSLETGTVSPRAGSSGPFVFDLHRGDGTRLVSAVTVALPPGLVGKLAGVPFCPDVVLAAAARSGTSEQKAPSCPAASRLGSAHIGAGAGPAPYFVRGSAYLSGPYKGAPFSLAIVVPVVAGPFDLGTVVVRSAVYVDASSARIKLVSDPFPQILRGIPLDVRSLAVVLDRPGFIRTPTSCDPTEIAVDAASPADVPTSLSRSFQVGDCDRLGFKPRVSLRLLGATHRSGHPALRTVLAARPADAGIRSLAVTLPGAELLDGRRVGAICGGEEFKLGRCPGRSVLGQAEVWTPLLARPLRGPVYLRAGRGRLPDLAASLHGQVDLTLVGRLDSVRGRLQTVFGSLPDVPLTKVAFSLRGKRRGLFVNTGGLCSRRYLATVRLTAHDGRTRTVRPRLRSGCDP